MSRTNRSHLLPPNALASERALSLAVQYDERILPEDIKSLWKPDGVPARFLSFLAWGLHVDLWQDELNDAHKRKLIASSFAWHRKKGTPWAVKAILADLGIQARILEWYDIGTEPHTFAVEASYDYANSEPFAINAKTRDLLLEAIGATKPERSHLAYFTFVPVDEGDPAHCCVHDVCHWSHGYLWTSELETGGISESARLLPDGICRRYTLLYVGSAVYEWSPQYGTYLFSGLARSAIEGTFSLYQAGTVSFAEGAHGNHKWHRPRSWMCGGTWEEGCCQRDVLGSILSFARSTATFGGPEVMGSANGNFSGGYELVVPEIGTYGANDFSGCALDGARYEPIYEFIE